MTTRSATVRAVARTVRRELLNLAQRRRRDFRAVLQAYALEGLARRIERSHWRDKVVLRGGLLLGAWLGDTTRVPPRLELLVRGEAPTAEALDELHQVLATTVQPDGLAFAFTEPAPAFVRSPGRTVTRRALSATLEKAAVNLAVEIGTGDIIFPAPVEIRIPPLLAAPAPELLGYRRETAIAETLDALTAGLLSRALEPVDRLYALSATTDFDAAVLARAIAATFRRRQRKIPQRLLLADEPTGRTQRRLARHWRTLGLGEAQPGPAITFAEAVEAVDAFVGPLLKAMAEPNLALVRWPAGGPWQ